MSQVPKFGSFRPKGTKTGDDQQHRAPEQAESGSEGHQPHDELSARKTSNSRSLAKHSDRLSKSNHSYHHRHRERPQSASSSSHLLVSQSLNVDSGEVFTDKHFIVDTRGDAKNAEYGSLHRYSVPTYHRIGYGRLVGAPPAAKLDREQSSTTQAVLTIDRQNQTDRPLRSRSLTFPRERRIHVVARDGSDTDIELQADYITLSQALLKRKRGSESPDASVEAVSYRSIYGKATTRSEVSDNHDLSDLSELEGESRTTQAESQAREEHTALLRRTKDNPADANTWFALIDHQVSVVKPGRVDEPLTAGERRTLAEIRLTIHEQALKHCKDLSEREKLLLGMLEHGRIVWDAAKLETKWNEAFRQCPTSVQLWLRYLDHVQTAQTNFRFDTVKAAYIRCLDSLRDVKPIAAIDADDKPGVARFHVLLRLTCFLRDAGHDEQAFALWQAILEYHFFKPPDVRDREIELGLLEAFWEADVPRIGEEGARGWKEYAMTRYKTARKPSSGVECSPPSSDPLRGFIDAETASLSKVHLPAATNEDDSTDDPFKYVMFSDLEPVLRPGLHDLPSPAVVDAFLAFMQLPPIAYTKEHAWHIDQFVRTSANTNKSSVINELFTSYSLFERAFEDCPSLVDPEKVQFVERVLEALIVAQPENDTLTEYYIAYKLHAQPKEAVKLCKRLLKQRPSSLRLYNAYALVEVKLGCMEKAARVWSAALKMSISLGVDGKDEAVRLWHCWVMSRKHQLTDEKGALQCLLAVCEDLPGDVAIEPDNGMDMEIPAAQKLRARQHFEAAWERLAHKRKLELAVLTAECHICYTYLIGGHSIEAAVNLTGKYSDRLSRANAPQTAHALLLQAQARLIQHHIKRHRPYRPALLRSVLEESVRSFPHDSLLLYGYIRNEAHFRLQDRIRLSLREDLLTGRDASIVGCSIAINEEVRRFREQTVGATQNAVRALFTRALVSPDSGVKHSIVLWTAWFEFELSLCEESTGGNGQEQALRRAKQVFLDGVRCLPWYKGWIVRGMRAFAVKGWMTDDELRQLYDVLMERELRVRTSTEMLDEI
ncbi:hypothetical protein BAUCODRAFT_38105 [Baudoinia panamericana UAMH 10762]|uniref:DUF1740-domain-containing protein n=1 Tax=Baudoinia panamericana (strain UAMH 10762) TaxID=717646 RepID=M2M715_BAUPA|nr:uncharacterized protein BAUCODRAFT_38105 [Baudoinia panamericana UAMH 10762]EMC92076.1 hypothetical protein BAUCODRAFT_38105 [Baudoinia panamericana UAMH 10762]